MKNIISQFKTSKQVIPVIIAILLTLSCVTNQFLLLARAESQAPAPYSKDYTVENILSDFQYFIKGDLTVGNHAVGAAASGGTANLSNFGDGAITSSYFEKIAKVGNYNSGSYLGSNNYDGTYKAYVGHYPAYYKEKETADTDTGSLTAYTGTTDYIDFTKAFTEISAESNAFVTNGKIMTVADVSKDQYNGNTLNINLLNSDGCNIVIPKDVYDSISYINLQVKSADDFSSHQYVISLSGVTDVNFTFGYISASSSSGPTGTKGIELNGKTFNNDNSLKKMSGKINSGELNKDGMKLIWNLPEAKTVSTDYTAGHILAPLAAVTVQSGTGNFEGSIISASLNNTSAEGHFYAYNAIPTVPVDNVAQSSSSTPSSSSAPSSSTPSSSTPCSSSTPSSSTPSSSAPSSSTPSSSTPSSSSSTSASGVVIDSKTGKVVQNIPTKVTAGANSTETVSVKTQDAVLFKQPDGTTSSLNDYSKLDISSKEDTNVVVSSDGNIEVKDLKKATDELLTVTYDLGNGQKITIGTIEVKVSSNGDVSVISKLIDPYGTLTDVTTGKVIAGAKVTLYYADTERNIASGKTPNTAVQLPKIDGFKPNNNMNPQVSNTNGTYGFMVFPNSDYYIVVTKDGYAKYISPTISVKQDIVKFDVKMSSLSSNSTSNNPASSKVASVKNPETRVENTMTGLSSPDTPSLLVIFLIISCTAISFLVFLVHKITRKSKQN